MFTGIVAGTARVLAIEEEGVVRKINIDLGGFSEGLEIGASVAIAVSYTHLTLPTIYSV